MDNYIDEDIILSKFCKKYIELKKDLPIRPSEMAVLNIIVQHEKRYTPLMIAEIMEVSKPMITAHIMALCKDGYIKKDYSLNDKRSFYIVPTVKAEELVKKSSEKTRTYLTRLKNELGDDDYKKLLNLMDNTNSIISDIRVNGMYHEVGGIK